MYMIYDDYIYLFFSILFIFYSDHYVNNVIAYKPLTKLINLIDQKYK